MRQFKKTHARLISLFVSAVMLCAMLPVSALAADTTVKTQQELTDAITSAADGDTITLGNNIDVSTDVRITSKRITLDLAGYDITPSASLKSESGAIIYVGSGGDLTVNDSSQAGTGAINNTIDEWYYYGLSVCDGGKAVINGGSIYGKHAGISVYGNGSDTTTLTVNGGSISGYGYAIATNGSTSAGKCNITINGGTISAESTAMFLPAVDSTTTINGGTITGATGIEIRAGELIVTGGTIAGTETSFSTTASGSGNTTLGAGIAVSQHTTDQPISVTISGGSVSGYYALYEKDLQNATAQDDISIAISGGTFKGTGTGSIAVMVEDTDATLAVSGGRFSSAIDSSDCASGYSPYTYSYAADGLVYSVAQKVSAPGIDKTSDSNDTIGTAAAGSTVNFELASTIGDDLVVTSSGGAYSGSYTLVFHDTMSSNMTLASGSIKVYVGGFDVTGYAAVTYPTLTDTCTFEVSVDCISLLNDGVWAVADAGKVPVVVTYSATVSSSASDGDTLTNSAYVNSSITDTIDGTVSASSTPTPPATGGTGTAIYTLLGVVLMGGAAAAFIATRRRKD